MGDLIRKWPALSEQLQGPKHRARCQSCGCDGSGDAFLKSWAECDDYDEPTAVTVVLCKACGDRLIEPHERLYVQVEANAPRPGAMEVCVGCRFRNGTTCINPMLKALGGPGLQIRHSKPTYTHISYREKGRRRGRWLTSFGAPPGCDGREPGDTDG